MSMYFEEILSEGPANKAKFCVTHPTPLMAFTYTTHNSSPHNQRTWLDRIQDQYKKLKTREKTNSVIYTYAPSGLYREGKSFLAQTLHTYLESACSTLIPNVNQQSILY